jgi:TP901 family phage tail tape measure protein
MGMGLLLQWKDQAARGMRASAANLKQLKGMSDETFKAFQKSADKLQEQSDMYRKRIGVSLKLAAGGAMLAAPLVIATKKAADFEDQMNDVSSLLIGQGASQAVAARGIEHLKNQLLDFAGTTRIAFNELAGAAYPMISALGIEQGSEAITTAANLAVAGKGSMGEAVQTMTAILATFGTRWSAAMTPLEKAERVFNTTAGAVAAYNTDLSKLSSGLAYATAPASSLGMSFAETASTLGMLQTMGLPDSMSGTALAAGLRGLTQLTYKFKDAGEEAKTTKLNLGDFLKDWGETKDTRKMSRRAQAAGALKGIEIKDESGKLLPLWRIVQNIEEVFGITSESAEETARKMKLIEEGSLSVEDAFKDQTLTVEQSAAMQAAFREEGGKAFTLMLGQSQALRAQAEILEDSTVGWDMLAERQKGLKPQWQMTKNSISAISDELGNVLLPDLVSLNKTLQGSIGWLREFSKAHPGAAKWVAYGQAGASALLSMGGSIGAVIFGLKMLQTQRAMLRLTEDMAGAKRSAGLFVGSLKTLTRVLSFAWVKTMALAVATGVAKAAQVLWNIAMMANPLGLIILGVAALAIGIVAIINNWDAVKKAAGIAIDWIGDKIGWLINDIKETWDWLLKLLGLAEEAQHPVVVAGAPGIPAVSAMPGSPGWRAPMYMPVSDVTTTKAPIYHDIPDTSEAAPKDELDLPGSS